jgi:hypothetical protein
MAPRDYASKPEADRLGLESVILGLADDLRALRAREITPNEAIARATVAKQIWNGVRIYLHAQSFLSLNSANADTDAKVLE